MVDKPLPTSFQADVEVSVVRALELAEFAAENKDWLRVYRLLAYAPNLNPAEGIWSLLKRAMANFAAERTPWSTSSSAC